MDGNPSTKTEEGIIVALTAGSDHLWKSVQRGSPFCPLASKGYHAHLRVGLQLALEIVHLVLHLAGVAAHLLQPIKARAYRAQLPGGLAVLAAVCGGVPLHHPDVAAVGNVPPACRSRMMKETAKSPWH